jgi:hypothetical protein
MRTRPTNRTTVIDTMRCTWVRVGFSVQKIDIRSPPPWYGAPASYWP